MNSTGCPVSANSVGSQKCDKSQVFILPCGVTFVFKRLKLMNDSQDVAQTMYNLRLHTYNCMSLMGTFFL